MAAAAAVGEMLVVAAVKGSMPLGVETNWGVAAAAYIGYESLFGKKRVRVYLYMEYLSLLRKISIKG